MTQFAQDDLTQVMGFGTLGEVRRGPEGDLYQWVQGVDGLGNPVGFWRKIARAARRVYSAVRRVAPVVERVASAIPHPYAQQVARGISTARQAGFLGYGALGALHQAPDGTVYEMEGFGQVEPDVVEGLGLGSYVGEVRAGADGSLYQWVQGVDGLGNPIGFWKKLKRAWKKVRPFVSKALPVVQKVASFIPHPAAQAVAAGIQTATPFLKRAGVLQGLGALYEAPDGTLYQVEGLGEEDLEGLADEEDVAGFGQELVPAGGNGDLEGYLRDEGPQTRWFTPPAQPPEAWKPLW